MLAGRALRVWRLAAETVATGLLRSYRPTPVGPTPALLGPAQTAARHASECRVSVSLGFWGREGAVGCADLPRPRLAAAVSAFCDVNAQ